MVRIFCFNNNWNLPSEGPKAALEEIIAFNAVSRRAARNIMVDLLLFDLSQEDCFGNDDDDDGRNIFR